MKKIILLGMAAAMSFASCQKNEEQTAEVGGSSEVVFTSGISTRATETQWEADDQIGVFMYSTDLTDIYDSNSENAPYTTSDAASGTFTSFDPLLYPSDVNVDFVAYYPYATNYSSNVITINSADQSDETKVKALDFMVASAQNCNDLNAPTLSFTRKMSKIVINVNRKDSRADAVLSDISLTNVIVDGDLSIINSPIYRENTSVAIGTTTSDISMFFNETSSTIEAIIIPQEYMSAMIKITIDGEEFRASISGSFAENTQYNYNFSIGNSSVELSGATISDWGTTEEGNLAMYAVDIEYNTETSTYDIYSANGMRAFSDLVNGSACSVSDLNTKGDSSYFNFGTGHSTIKGKLVCDIDLGGIDSEGKGIEQNKFTPIGKSSYQYGGTFDGNGYQISGLYINDSSSSYQGLFGSISSATIKNLTVSGSVTGNMYNAGIAGNISTSTIYNCTNLATVNGSSNIGGVVGMATQSTIEKCINKGSIISSGTRTGGVVGYHCPPTIISDTSTPILCVMLDCGNEGYVEGLKNTGGVLGEGVGRLSITNCYNKGDIKGTGSDGNIGGILGYGSTSSSTSSYIQLVSCCYNTGSIDGTQNVGGIMGYSYKYDIENCYNMGAIDGESNIGGIIGKSWNLADLSYCYNTGSVKATGSNSGGVAGYANYTTLYCCISNSSVVGGESATTGGVLGTFSDSNSKASYCIYDSLVLPNFSAIGTSSVTDITEVYGVDYLTIMMTNGEGVSLFNEYQTSSPWQDDVTPNINGGYPILIWQVE